MGMSYKQATYTIVAANAETVSKWFLSKFKTDDVMAKLSFYLGEQSTGQIYVPFNTGDTSDHDDDHLFTRGWALQEVLLSPRKLIFDAYQLIISCGHDKFETIAPTYLDFEEVCADLPSTIFGMPDQNLEEMEDGESTECYINKEKVRIWGSIITHYSGRDLPVLKTAYLHWRALHPSCRDAGLMFLYGQQVRRGVLARDPDPAPGLG
jgi:hypothetical protein